MSRNTLTSLLDLLGISLVVAGLVGYDWRLAVIVAGVLILIVSRINA